MSNETDKATPRPWEVVHGDEGQIFIFGAGCEVAELYTDNADCIEAVEADAALIVKTVNSHDKLVEACELLMQATVDYREQYEAQCEEGDCGCSLCAAVSEARAALDSAK